MSDRLLHTHGGTPITRYPYYAFDESSPHAWRYSSAANRALIAPAVFSTRVEVLLRKRAGSTPPTSLLHGRGGIPSSQTDFSVFRTSSPRGGGTPCSGRASSLASRSSPRPWRYTAFLQDLARWPQVFSTHAEVVLRSTQHVDHLPSLLRTCGGTPDHFDPRKCGSRPSPRAWRFFPRTFFVIMRMP